MADAKALALWLALATLASNPLQAAAAKCTRKCIAPCTKKCVCYGFQRAPPQPGPSNDRRRAPSRPGPLQRLFRRTVGLDPTPTPLPQVLRQEPDALHLLRHRS